MSFDQRDVLAMMDGSVVHILQYPNSCFHLSSTLQQSFLLHNLQLRRFTTLTTNIQIHSCPQCSTVKRDILHSEALKNQIRDTECADAVEVGLLAVSTRVDISSYDVFARQSAHTCTFRNSSLDIGEPAQISMVHALTRMPRLAHREPERLGLDSGVGSPPWKVK